MNLNQDLSAFESAQSEAGTPGAYPQDIYEAMTPCLELCRETEDYLLVALVALEAAIQDPATLARIRSAIDAFDAQARVEADEMLAEVE